VIRFMMRESLLRGIDNSSHCSVASLFGASRHGLRSLTMCIVRFFGATFLLVQQWWLLTTSSTFLSSPGSRRWIWSWCIAAVGFLDFVADVFDGQNVGVLAIDVFALVFGIMLGCRLPVQSLVSDAILVVTAAVCWFVYYSMSPPSDAACSVVNIPWTPIMVMLLHGVGIHSMFIAFYCVLTSRCVATIHPQSADNCIAVQVATVTMVVFIACMEFHTAVISSKYHKQVGMTNWLLDTITDGFGSIDDSGAILETSAQLLRTLGSSNLIGRHLSDFAENDCDRALLNGIFESVVAQRNAGGSFSSTFPTPPVLVTMRRELDSAHFEVKVSSYDWPENGICFCLQKQGEVRLPHPQEEDNELKAVASSGIDMQNPYREAMGDAWSVTSISESPWQLAKQPGQVRQLTAPLGPPFAESDDHTFEHSVSLLDDLVESWNISGTACCLWHLHIGRLRRLVSQLESRRRCDDGWAPTMEFGQCSSCLALSLASADSSICWLCSLPMYQDDTYNQQLEVCTRGFSLTSPPRQSCRSSASSDRSERQRRPRAT